jgi:hypothetical protein
MSAIPPTPVSFENEIVKLRESIGKNSKIPAFISNQFARIEMTAAKAEENCTTLREWLTEIDKRAADMIKAAFAIRAEAQAELAKAEWIVVQNDGLRLNARLRGIIPFAGGDGDYSVLSIIAGPHSIGEGIFGFLTMRDSNALRPLCREMREAIRVFPWMDAETRVIGDISRWRAAFPAARAVNISYRKYLGIKDLKYIRGSARLHTVNMSGCRALLDSAFKHLQGIHTLIMDDCVWRIKPGHTDVAFTHLKGIQKLSMRNCDQESITDVAFSHLRGIRELYMSNCAQRSITDAAFVHLQGIKVLYINGCTQLSDAVFPHLKGISTLNMDSCHQAAITDSAFSHLKGIHSLFMRYCRQATITGQNFEHIRGVNTHA